MLRLATRIRTTILIEHMPIASCESLLLKNEIITNKLTKGYVPLVNHLHHTLKTIKIESQFIFPVI